MKYFSFLLLLCFHYAFSQADSTANVKELGWTFKLPRGFIIIDTATLNAESRAREREIHWIKKPTGPIYKQILFWARDSAGEVILVECVDEKHDTLGLNFPNVRFPNAGESDTTEEVYDGVRFHKLRTVMNTNPYPYINSTMKTAYEGKIFTINYAVGNKSREEEIISMLKGSKFVR